MAKTINGPARAFAAVVILAAGAGMLSACDYFSMRGPASSQGFENTAHWDAEKGQYVTEKNPDYDPDRRGSGGD